MLKTTELRWFSQGLLPQLVKHWFQQSCLKEQPPEEREDLYLSTAGCEHLGIKLRQEKLEVKWRSAELGVFSSAQNIEGQAEEWFKWTCADLTAKTTALDAIMATGPWVKIFKARSQQKYQVLPNHSTVAVAPSKSIDHGCAVELTQLQIRSDSWWSLAFEAFGHESDQGDNLEAIARSVLETYPGPQLRLQDSYAYPKWLSTATP